MIEMKVRGIAIDRDCKQPMVVLTDSEEKFCLPILIGVPEATAIFIQLSDQTISRPMSHDLLKNVVEALGAKVTKILVSDLNKDTFFARIFLENPHNGEKMDIDARPSDAIALALRTGSPIFVAEKVVVVPGVAIMDKEKNKEEMREFKSFLEHLSPADFNFQGKRKND
jgi:bifunctional DNase/RNase